MINKILAYFGLKIIKLPKLKSSDFNGNDNSSTPFANLTGKPTTLTDYGIADSLSSVIRDTEIDTSLINKEVPEHKPKTIKKKRHEIKIFFRDGHISSYISDVNADSKWFPYSDFFKWYLSKNTPIFGFQYDVGELFFLRDDIVRVERMRPVIVVVPNNG